MAANRGPVPVTHPATDFSQAFGNLLRHIARGTINANATGLADCDCDVDAVRKPENRVANAQPLADSSLTEFAHVFTRRL